MNPSEAEALTHGFAEALANFNSLIQPMQEAVDGYRADAERRGYSPTVAEAMAMEFHSYLMAQFRSAIAGTTP